MRTCCSDLMYEVLQIMPRVIDAGELKPNGTEILLESSFGVTTTC